MRGRTRRVRKGSSIQARARMEQSPMPMYILAQFHAFNEKSAKLGFRRAMSACQCLKHSTTASNETVSSGYARVTEIVRRVRIPASVLDFDSVEYDSLVGSPQRSDHLLWYRGGSQCLLAGQDQSGHGSGRTSWNLPPHGHVRSETNHQQYFQQ